ncbi:MAG: hypothetical protein MUD08_16660 [Cytophagales bacterium]|jgi:hypothetical protein|nr:hypothetical protein [Cytophagales bacterium]
MKFPLKTLVLLTVATSVSVSAQTVPAPPLGDNSCASQWYWLFKERGATSIPNGVQPVVVSVKKYGVNHCLMGKIQVKDGKLVFPLYLEKEDGTSMEVLMNLTAAQMAKEPNLLTIHSGCSNRFLSADKEEIELFFYKSLNPKPTSFKRAPPVSDFQ